MTNPTLAAQAIRAAVEAEFNRSSAPPTVDDLAAAVLKAAADQIIPLHHTAFPPGATKDEKAEITVARGYRRKLLALATELSPEADHA